MRMSRSWNAAVVAVLTAGGLALGAASPAATAQAGGRRVRTAGAAPAGPAARLPVPGSLDGVAARSPGSAWAVGQTSSDSTASDRPILAHWNGTAWRTVTSPALPSRGALNAVATFPGGGWAVGQAGVLVGGGVPRLLIVRLAGTAVRRVPIPGPGDGELFGVAATSAANAWAVGRSDRPLILHWNGTAWTRARLPSPVGLGVFTAVAATSRTNAWAVLNPARQPGRARIVHWNGMRWGQVVSPAIGGSYRLFGVAAISARNAWAVGFTGSGRTVILHWDGLRWNPVPSPDGFLLAVSASSADNAWAVGLTGSGTRALALHWNGRSWKQATTPDSGLHSHLGGVSFIPPSRHAWAVGNTAPPVATLILQWNGTAWH